MRVNAKPLQVALNLLGELPARPFDVRVVETQDETPIRLQREKPVEQRRARVADMMWPVGDGAKRTVVFMRRA
ncbi:hypothetical protein NTH_04133 [Nitratireductor thuwali]|uniref:Uncharacterized protein n=1 Tax=Nitratireductor thuwali TaxID=2267699 RepID=A0ABY5MP70_9HYPH|nr:hypothetical protein NTH_04133 [Nitratireductor thuwali]